MTIPFTTIGHTALRCKDFSAMMAFYTDKLGLSHAFDLRNPDGEISISYVRLPSGQFIELFNDPYDGPNDTANVGAHHVCLLVDDIVAAARACEAKGLTLYSGPRYMGKRFTEAFPADPVAAGLQGRSGSLQFYIQDPEGNEIELMQYTPGCLQLKYGADAAH